MRFTMRLLCVIATLTISSVFAGEPSDAKPVRNVIMMVPDGTSLPCYTFARWVKGSTLNLDPYACALVRTYSANAIITDSAASATAYATGHKVKNGAISMTSDGKPLPTVAELAHKEGRSVGLVVTCHIVDATPAAFSSHSPSRKNFEDILKQQINSGFEVLMGGGTKFLTPEIAASLKKDGYETVTDKAGMEAAKATKLFGLFGSHAMAYDYDRNPEIEPSLAEMTQKAISLLSANPKGFFLLVEGSKIDWAAHNNNPVGVVSETLAFDAAFKVARDFALKNGDTAIIVCADHGNGGVSLNASSLDSLKSLKAAKRTPEGLQRELQGDPSPDAIKAKVGELYGIDNLTDEEQSALMRSLEEQPPKQFVAIASSIMSKRTQICWTTGNHTGEESILFCLAPGPRPAGVIENTDVNRWLRAWLSCPPSEND